MQPQHVPFLNASSVDVNTGNMYKGFPLWGAWGASYDFFSKTLPPHQNWCPPLGHPPLLKNEVPPSEKQTPPLPKLKHEVPFHEMTLRKSTINNNLKSS